MRNNQTFSAKTAVSLTSSLWFTRSHFEVGGFGCVVNVWGRHGQGIHVVFLQRHKATNVWSYNLGESQVSQYVQTLIEKPSHFKPNPTCSFWTQPSIVGPSTQRRDGRMEASENDWDMAWHFLCSGAETVHHLMELWQNTDTWREMRFTLKTDELWHCSV